MQVHNTSNPLARVFLSADRDYGSGSSANTTSQVAQGEPSAEMSKDLTLPLVKRKEIRKEQVRLLASILVPGTESGKWKDIYRALEKANILTLNFWASIVSGNVHLSSSRSNERLTLVQNAVSEAIKGKDLLIDVAKTIRWDAFDSKFLSKSIESKPNRTYTKRRATAVDRADTSLTREAVTNVPAVSSPRRSLDPFAEMSIENGNAAFVAIQYAFGRFATSITPGGAVTIVADPNGELTVKLSKDGK